MAPDVCRVLLDNPYVGVMEYRATQGQKVAMHSHPAFLDVNPKLASDRPRNPLQHPHAADWGIKLWNQRSGRKIRGFTRS